MKRPVYRLVIDEETEGMDFMGLVDMPAHGKSWTTMSRAPRKLKVKSIFNSEKQIVTGVAIATSLLIYRRDPDGYEYDVYLTKEDVLQIMKMFAKKGYHNNVNLMHDQSQKVKDAYLIESYFIWDNKKNIPEAFANQNLQPGSLIFSYWVEGKDSWKFIKEQGTGFSLEGWFKELPVKFQNQKPNKMSKKKKSLMERLGFKAEPTKATYDEKAEYASAVNTDGDTVEWEGDLTEGTSIFVIPEEGDPILAPEGEMTIYMDGTMVLINVDESGVVTSVQDVEEEMEEDEEMAEAMTAMKSDYEKKFSDQKKKFDKQEKQIIEMAKTIDELTVAVELLSEGKAPKTTPVRGDGGYASLRGKK